MVDGEDRTDTPIGTIQSLSSLIATEYMLSGYSLTEEDIKTALIIDFAIYSAWGKTYAKENNLAVSLDQNQIVSFGDWAVLEQLVKAHCDLIQAQRVEATGSLGGERFGLTVSEANQIYNSAKESMKKEAFVEKPYVI
ncbi:hypothetical protein KTH44_15900 [Acinetobacter bereziniae]|nr:hypothetical protein [Acinetobacter bereziniae]